MTLKALTCVQPWAALIATGRKLVENRGRPTNLRGDIAIHAGKTPDLDEILRAQRQGIEGSFAVLGAVVAVAELVGCHRAEQAGESCCGPYGWRLYNGNPAFHLVLANVRLVPTPVDCRGQLGFWNLPTEPVDIEGAVRAQLPLLPEEA